MSRAAIPLLTAVMARLRAETTTAVHGRPVPQGTDFPYQTVGSGTGLNDDDKTTEGEDRTFIVEAWSQHLGEAEAGQILSDAYGALHGRDLSVVGWGVSILRWITDDIMLDPDGKTTHGVARYRAKLKSTA